MRKPNPLLSPAHQKLPNVLGLDLDSHFWNQTNQANKTMQKQNQSLCDLADTWRNCSFYSKKQLFCNILEKGMYLFITLWHQKKKLSLSFLFFLSLQYHFSYHNIQKL